MEIKMVKHTYVGIGLLVAGIALGVFISLTTEWVRYENLGNIMLPSNEMLPYFIASIPILIAGIVLTIIGLMRRKTAKITG